MLPDAAGSGELRSVGCPGDSQGCSECWLPPKCSMFDMGQMHVKGIAGGHAVPGHLQIGRAGVCAVAENI